MNATIDVTVEIVNASSDTQIPSRNDFRRWTEAALIELDNGTEKAELSIRVVDEAESAQLNEQYRHKHGATNILSFPYTGIPGTCINLLGDLAICAPLVRKEADTQRKPVLAHWAHLTVHGVLHLNGYNHEVTDAAVQMETMEIRILDTLGFRNPYLPDKEGQLDEQGNE